MEGDAHESGHWGSNGTNLWNIPTPNGEETVMVGSMDDGNHEDKKALYKALGQMLYGLKFEANQTEGIFPQNVLSQIESILQDQLHPGITTITIRSENYSDPNTDVLRGLICEYFGYFDQEKLKPQGGMMFTPGKAYDINIQYNPYPKDIYERIKGIWITPYVPDTPPPSLSK